MVQLPTQISLALNEEVALYWRGTITSHGHGNNLNEERVVALILMGPSMTSMPPVVISRTNSLDLIAVMDKVTGLILISVVMDKHTGWFIHR